jgi:hypothetical protein
MAGSHGSNPASWTAVSIVVVGFLVGAFGLVFGPNWLMFWIGVALLPVAVIVGRVLRAMGLGEAHPPRI